MSEGRLLLVEDEPALARGLSDTLRAQGFDVHIADDGQKGLDAALSLAIVVLSAVSAFYYLRVVAVMYFDEPERELRPAQTRLLNVGIGAMAIATLLGGIIFSNDIITLAERWYRALTVMAFVG